jgi:hypothetical protein
VNWNLFLEGHRFTTTNCMGMFEVDLKKLDLNAHINGVSPKHRLKNHFIRIGVLHANSPRKIEMQKDSDGRLIVIPPRLNGLRIKQQSFRQFTEQYKWNYILDNNADEGHKDEDNGEDDEDDSDVDSEENAINSHTTINKKRKYNAVQGRRHRRRHRRHRHRRCCRRRCRRRRPSRRHHDCRLRCSSRRRHRRRRRRPLP